MLVSKIISLAESQSDESYDKEDWVDLINLCQDELTPLAKILEIKSGIAVTVASGKASITIASDADLAKQHRILNVYYTPTIAGGTEGQLRRLQPKDNYSKGWKLDATKVYLQGLSTETAGTVRVDFYKKLTHIQSVSDAYVPDTPDIPEEYHGIYVSFLCSKSQQREEETEDQSVFEAQYNSAKQAFALDRLIQMEPWNAKNLQTVNG